MNEMKKKTKHSVQRGTERQEQEEKTATMTKQKQILTLDETQYQNTIACLARAHPCLYL